MKALLVVLVTASLAPVSFAQRGVSGGFGNVAHPGTPSSNFSGRTGPAFRGTVRRSGIYAAPAFVGGAFYAGDFAGTGYGYGYGYNGDASGYGYAAQAQPPVNVTVVNAPPQAPTVIINQNFGPQPDAGSSETARVYQPSYQPAANNNADTPAQPHYFLIAFKDHSVYSALAYWIEDKTMHYVTPQQTHNQASLDLIDLDFTNKLNQR